MSFSESMLHAICARTKRRLSPTSFSTSLWLRGLGVASVSTLRSHSARTSAWSSSAAWRRVGISLGCLLLVPTRSEAVWKLRCKLVFEHTRFSVDSVRAMVVTSSPGHADVRQNTQERSSRARRIRTGYHQNGMNWRSTSMQALARAQIV